MSKPKNNSKALWTDAELINLFFKRNEKAISETDKKYGKRIFGVAYHILHDRNDCEECQNDTYLAAWNTIPPTRPSNFPAFLIQLVRRIAVNRYHAKSCQKRIPSAMTVSTEELFEALRADSIDEEYETRELGRLMSEFVGGLPKQSRFLFVGRFYMAEEVAALAKELSVSKRTVYRELEVIKKDLRQFLLENEVYI